MHQLILDVGFYSTGDAADVEIWNDNVVSEYPDFSIQNIHTWLNSDLEWRRQGEVVTADLMICNMAIFNAKLGGKNSISCACTKQSCCTADDPSLCAGEDLDGDVIEDLTTRDLDKRAGPRPVSVRLNNGNTVRFRSVTYPSRGDFVIGNPIWSMAFEYANAGDCLDADVDTTVITVPADRNAFEVEHIVELNTIQAFLQNAADGQLPTGAHPRNLELPADYIEALNTQMLIQPPPMAGGGPVTLVPLQRIMTALGSSRNSQDFVVLISALNGLKSRIWRSEELHAHMDNTIADDDYIPALQNIRSVISVIHYLNDRRVHPRMVHAANLVRAELGLADQEWITQAGYNPRGQDWWDQWFRDRMRFIGQQASENGWTADIIGFRWLKELFEPYSRRYTTGAKRLLILDGHSSHLIAEFDTFCKENAIICLCMPAHASHLLQPLDVGVFGPLKRAYGKLLEGRMKAGHNHIDKEDFLSLYPEAREKVFTSANIGQGFAGAGLKPFNKGWVLAKITFQLRTPTPPTLEDSASSAFQAPQNPRQLGSKARSLQKSPSARRQNLSSSPVAHIHHLEKAAQMAMHMNCLLQQEIRALRAENERKTKKKARRRAILGNDTLLSVQEGQDRVQQLDMQFNEQHDEPTPLPRRRAPQRCSGCGTVGHTIRNCSNR